MCGQIEPSRRSECGRSPIPFHPGWDGGLETEGTIQEREVSHTSWKDKHLSVSFPRVDHLWAFPSIHPFGHHSLGAWCTVLDAWGGQGGEGQHRLASAGHRAHTQLQSLINHVFYTWFSFPEM